ncbi:DUF4915 domain-containing protein [Nostoc sp.]|uniref:DUF4915 domain-containing protein n=1 Tax=Nostoc sp. TaxID=1180 RepID=UPI002FFC0FC7
MFSLFVLRYLSSRQEKLWLLNSGTEEFSFADLKRGVFESVVFCPGYLRGCAFYGNFAVVGISQPRHNKTFSGLALETSKK